MASTPSAGGQGYHRLEVYQEAHALGCEGHALSLRLPRYEQYETGGQLRTAARSVSANIVEGYGRKTYPAEYLRFLICALASCDEAKEWLRYIEDCHPPLQADAQALTIRMEGLGRKLRRLIDRIAAEDRHAWPPRGHRVARPQ